MVAHKSPTAQFVIKRIQTTTFAHCRCVFMKQESFLNRGNKMGEQIPIN